MSSSDRKYYRNSLGKQILLASFFFVLILCLIISIFSLEVLRNVLMNQYQDRIGETLKMTMSQIDVEDLKQRMETYTSSNTFEKLKDYMNDAREAYSLEYLVICQPVKRNDGSYDMIQVYSGLNEEERAGQNLIAGVDIPLLGDSIAAMYPDYMLEELYNEMISNRDIKYSHSETQFGSTFGGAMTICDEQGNGIALLSAGIKSNTLLRTQINYFIILLFLSLVSGIVFQIFMNIWLNRKVLIPLKKIEESANDFSRRSHGQLNPDALLMERPDVNKTDELGSLADTLVTMSQYMKTYVQNILDNANKIQNMESEISRISDIAMKDALTGVGSLAAFENKKKEIDDQIVQNKADFGVAMFDLNNLKTINDNYGHDKGDIYIRNSTKVICDVFKHSPVYRVGGDEFVAIIQDSSDDINDLINLLESRLKSDEKDQWQNISIAVGYARFDQAKDKSFEDVLKRADANMYDKKKEMKRDLKKKQSIY